MKYKTQLKYYLINNNYSLLADGYSSLRLQNKGNTDLVINNTITVAPGENFIIELEPYCIIDNQFNISFIAPSSGTATNKALIMLTYNREI